MLGNDGVQLNGVVLISSILNYNIRAGGYDMLYIANLPSYAAAAWYFNKIPNKPANLGGLGAAGARVCLRPLCAGAVCRAQPARRATGHGGQRGEPPDRPERGLREGSQPAHFAHRFRKEVLREDRRTLGRYDMRFEGVDLTRPANRPATTPPTPASAARLWPRCTTTWSGS
jgi:hypothetical protein